MKTSTLDLLLQYKAILLDRQLRAPKGSKYITPYIYFTAYAQCSKCLETFDLRCKRNGTFEYFLDDGHSRLKDTPEGLRHICGGYVEVFHAVPNSKYTNLRSATIVKVRK